LLKFNSADAVMFYAVVFDVFVSLTETNKCD